MLRFPDDPEPGNARREEESRGLHELRFTQGLLQPVRADFRSPERSQRWLFGSPFGVGASFFPIERHPPTPKSKGCQITPESRRTSATKGLLVLPGLGGGEGASALSVIQLLSYWVRI